MLLIVTSAVATVADRLQGRTLMQPWEPLAALTFTINYVQALSGHASLLLAHIWSLSVEEHSYAILALIAFLTARRPRAGLLILGLISAFGLLEGLVLYKLRLGGVHEIYWRTDVRIAAPFLSGATYLWLQDSRLDRVPFASAIGWLPLLLVPLTAALYFVAPIPVTYSASAIFLSVSVNALDYSPEFLKRALSIRFLTAFGFLSYSIYLWQQPFYAAIGQVTPLLLVPAVLLTGLASFRLVEQPARRRINEHFDARRLQRAVVRTV